MSAELAALLFPDAMSVEEVNEKYPPRDLPDGALVTRFGPSPTGFIHIGGVMTGLLNRTLSRQTGGVFILRIEDTDQAREIAGGTALIVKSFANVGIDIDESPDAPGAYGPYKQSERLALYHAYARDFVARGLAYPCFMTSEELTAINEAQEAKKIQKGIYGEWAKSRSLSFDDVKAKLDAGEKWVVRLKTTAQIGDRIKYVDRLRGELELPANPLDTVIIKADGFPTYHFAHPIDDTLMRMSLIIRGDEWISSVPIHLQIFEGMGGERPPIAHIAPVEKNVEKDDGTTSRRKLSKRLDPEASMTYYDEVGYPPDAVIEYLLNLLDSGFEGWRAENPDRPYADFELSMDRLSKSGALLDLVKLKDISKDVVARYSKDDLFDAINTWAKSHDDQLAKEIAAQPDIAKEAFNIGREGDKPRKDIGTWNDVPARFGYFFPSYFEEKLPAAYEVFPELGKDEIVSVLNFFLERVETSVAAPGSEWIAPYKDYALENGYAKNAKKAKKNPDQYKGAFSDFMNVARVAITGSQDSPDLHASMVILGAEEIRTRLNRALRALTS